MPRLSWILSAVFLACAPVAGPSDAGGCETGTTDSCACDDGGTGVRACGDDGTFGACRCEATCGDSLAACDETHACCAGFACEGGACRGLAGKSCVNHAGCTETLLCIDGLCGPCREVTEPCNGNGDCCGVAACLVGFCEEG